MTPCRCPAQILKLLGRGDGHWTWSAAGAGKSRGRGVRGGRTSSRSGGPRDPFDGQDTAQHRVKSGHHLKKQQKGRLKGGCREEKRSSDGVCHDFNKTGHCPRG